MEPLCPGEEDFIIIINYFDYSCVSCLCLIYKMSLLIQVVHNCRKNIKKLVLKNLSSSNLSTVDRDVDDLASPPEYPLRSEVICYHLDCHSALRLQYVQQQACYPKQLRKSF